MVIRSSEGSVLFSHGEAGDPIQHGGGSTPRSRRLTAAARRSSILKAARRAFIETESHHSGKAFDRDRALQLVSEGTVNGSFPSLDPSRRQR